MRLALLLLILCSSLVHASPRETLCEKDELVAFSCHVGAKIVSLCASPDLSPTKGFVQYRYGKKRAIELAYPAGKEHPSTHFRWGVLGFSGGGTDYFRFSNLGFDYVVYSGLGRGWAKEGVVVEKDGKRVASLVCRDSALDADNWKVMYAAEVPKITQPNDFEMP